MTTSPDAGAAVGVVVALKTSTHAKSRLSPIPDPVRRRLAWTMAVDTLRALSAVAGSVVVVSDEPALHARLRRAGLDSIGVMGEQGAGGMNTALEQGADALRSSGPTRVLACVGDLPALRPSSLAVVLGAADAYDRAYLPDATGVGTTMLLAAAGAALRPHFQGRSAAAHHASGAIPLADDRLGTPTPDARRDVDTEVDLADAHRLGLGTSTAALLDPATGRVGAYAVVTTVGGGAVTAAGVRVDLPADRLADGLRVPRPGQRLHAVLAEGTVLSAWL